MRRARVDENQPEIVRDLRQVPGLSVAHTHMVGDDFPDLVVGWMNQNFLVEVKQSPKHSLSEGQERFHQAWNGPIIVAFSADDVLRALGII